MPREWPQPRILAGGSRLLPVAVTCSFAENLSHFLSVQLQFHPRERGTLVMKCPMGFSSADPSVDSSDRSLTGQQLLTLVLQLPWGICTYLTERGCGFLCGSAACLSWRCSLSFQPQEGQGSSGERYCSQQHLVAPRVVTCKMLLVTKTLLFCVYL